MPAGAFFDIPLALITVEGQIRSRIDQEGEEFLALIESIRSKDLLASEASERIIPRKPFPEAEKGQANCVDRQHGFSYSFTRVNRALGQSCFSRFLSRPADPSPDPDRPPEGGKMLNVKLTLKRKVGAMAVLAAVLPVLNDLEKCRTHLHPEIGIEIRERFVQEQNLGLQRQSPGQRDPLLLPAAQLLDVTVSQPVQMHEMEQFSHALVDPLLLPVMNVQSVADVLSNRHVREKRIILETHLGPRLSGVTSLMILPSRTTSPELDLVNPPMILRSVVFPQPLGPTKVARSPSQIRADTPFKTSTFPKLLCISLNSKIHAPIM